MYSHSHDDATSDVTPMETVQDDVARGARRCRRYVLAGREGNRTTVEVNRTRHARALRNAVEHRASEMSSSLLAEFTELLAHDDALAESVNRRYTSGDPLRSKTHIRVLDIVNDAGTAGITAAEVRARTGKNLSGALSTLHNAGVIAALAPEETR